VETAEDRAEAGAEAVDAQQMSNSGSGLEPQAGAPRPANRGFHPPISLRR
jgi:hypothetical protein